MAEADFGSMQDAILNSSKTAKESTAGEAEKPRKREASAPVAKAEESPEVTKPATSAVVEANGRVAVTIEKLQGALAKAQTDTVALIRNPTFRTTTLSTGGGAVTLGAVGGAFGLASGVVVGGAAGVIPAIFTFGLSIPAGAAIGGGTGLALGTVGGAGAGAVGGGTIGYGAYTYRVEILDGVVYVRTRAEKTINSGKELAAGTANNVRDAVVPMASAARQRVDDSVTSVRNTVTPVIESAQKGVNQTVTFVAETAASPKFQVTVASAGGGAVAGGCTGGLLGAAVGVVPAIFTFGLSIPVGMAIGTATGGTAGAVGAGAVGFGGYTYRKEIRETAGTVVTQVGNATDAVSNSAKGMLKSVTGVFKRG